MQALDTLSSILQLETLLLLLIYQRHEISP